MHTHIELDERTFPLLRLTGQASFVTPNLTHKNSPRNVY